MAITAPPNCAVRNRDENRAQNTWRTPESGVSLSQFYWRTRTIHQNAGVSRRKLATAFARSIPVIPVLLEETPLPEKSQLSENIQKLSSQMGVRIRSSSFDRDVETLENFITILIDQRNFNFSRQSFEERPLRAFDIFLCHNSQDKQFGKEIAEQLITRGFRPWLDEWELQPGRRWQKTLENEIDNIRTAAIFVGESGFGPWQNLEMDSFLHAFVERQCPIIPVLLKTCQITPKLPTLLRSLTWVDFRKSEPDPMAQLVWGISGERPMPK
jgi:TIR domain